MHSCLSEVVESLTIRFFLPKILCWAKFHVILTLKFRIYGYFSQKFNGRYIRFGFSEFPFHEKSISFYSFQDIGMRSAAFYSQLNCAKTSGNRILIICSKIFLQPSKVKKKLKKKFWLWEALICCRDKKSKFCFYRFLRM